ncbi:MAG: ATP-binding cassette domain-containing protein, partial [Comamonadaceae bacterium]
MSDSLSPTASAAATADSALVTGGSRLEAMHLQKSYGSRKVVKDVSLTVQKGEVVGLLGPNGAGKTTSFYMIVGLVRAVLELQKGEDGKPLPRAEIEERLTALLQELRAGVP